MPLDDADRPSPAARPSWIVGGFGIGALLIVLAAAAGSWIALERARTIEAGERSAASLVRVLEEQTARSFEAVALTLAGIVDNIELNPERAVHDRAFEDAMRERLTMLPHVRALFVIGPDGFITQDTDHPSTPRISLADREYFRAHAADPALGMRIGQPLVSRSVSRWFATVSRRIDRPDGGFGGVAVAAVEPLYFERFYRDLGLGRSGVLALCRDDGVLIARFPRLDDFVGRDYANLDLFHGRLPASSVGQFRSVGTLDGVPRIVAFRRVSGLPLVVLVGLAEPELLAVWHRNAVVIGAAVLAVAALAMLLAALWIQQADERRRAVARSIQVQKMQAIGRLAGGVAHDFNNLLGAMLGYAEFLREDLPNGSRARDYADRLARIGERARDIVRQILVFAQPSASDLRPVAPAAAFADAETVLRASLPARTVLRFEAEDGVPAVRANATQLLQVIMNLCLNAQDACDGRPCRIEVRARRHDPPGGPDDTASWPGFVALPAPCAGPFVAFEVRDDGPGMGEAILARLCEPFFTTKDAGKGVGLGLSVVYGIAESHAGGLEFRSRVGAGTLVRLLLPAVAEPEAGRRLRVLVVDDGRDMGDMLLEGLSRLGHEVAVCEDAEEALDVFEEEPDAFDVVVADQTMPGMTGLQLIQRLKDRRPGLPCMLYTGYGEAIDAAAAAAGGADAFMTKPVSVRALAHRLGELVRAREAA